MGRRQREDGEGRGWSGELLHTHLISLMGAVLHFTVGMGDNSR